MPTPVAHTLAATAIHLAARSRSDRKPWLLLGGLVVLANIPDIDFLPGYLIGDPRAFHWGATHSLVAALIASALAATAGRAAGWPARRVFALGAIAYATHIMLDMLLGPGAASKGLEVLWPFTGERFMFPRAVFLMAPASIEQVGPLRALFTPGIIPVIARELAIMIPVCLAAWYVGRVRTSRARRGRQACTTSVHPGAGTRLMRPGSLRGPESPAEGRP